MGLKDFYLKAEDKYYELLEKIDSKVPITKLTDAIDSIVPSFAVLIVLVLLLLGFLFVPLITGTQDYSFTITVKDPQGKKLSGIQASVFLGTEEQSLTTDSEGRIELKAGKGTQIKIKINETRFEEIEKTFVLNQDKQEFSVELTEITSGPTQAILRFTDKNGKYITGKEITIRLSCRNSAVTPSPSVVRDSDKDGEITVSIPRNCEVLLVDSVEVQGYENWFGSINSGVETISLQGIDSGEALGDLRVIVKSVQGNSLNGIEVSLKKGNTTIQKEFTDSGMAEFTGIETGSYDLLVQDPASNFETKKIYAVEIEQQTVNERIVELELTKKGTLKVTVKDKSTNSRIKNAKVVIEDETGEVIGEKDSGENAETIEFALYSKGSITVKASANGYLPETLETEFNADKEIEIKLEKATSANSGKLVITVIDEEGKKVANARIMLKNEDGSLLTEYPEKFSDAKGTVKYSGIKKGIYFAYAEKYPASGLSEQFEITLTEETEVELKLVIGKAVLKLTTIDKDGVAVPNTRVKVKSIDEEKEFTLDAGGTTSIEIKADKRVHFEFYDPKNVYAKYVTKEYQLFPKDYEITAILEEQISGENLWVELKGVYFNEEKQDTLAGGKKYSAVIKLFVPAGESYQTAGIHFRTGNDSNPFIENDIVWIEKINAPNASKIKGKTWNPKTGQNTDFDSDNSASANAEAKWANIVWNNVTPGVYEAEIELRVKEEATENDVIALNYRAWGKGTRYYYFPADNELGTSSGTTTKQGLYAETLQEEFNTEDEVPFCMENNLCLRKQKLTDKIEEPFLIQKKLAFETKTNGVYEYSFEITNNSLSVYDEPEIIVKLIDSSEEETANAEISYYEIKTAEGQTKTNTSVNSPKTAGISLGRFGRQSVIQGTIGIKTKNAGRIFVNLSVYEKTNGGSDKIFDNTKTTEIKIKTGKEIQLEVLPELIPALVETPVTVEVKDEQGTELDEAVIKLNVIEVGNKRITIASKKTGRTGEAEFIVPALEPKTRIEFTAEKIGFETALKEIVLTEEVFELEPEIINETLSERDNPSVTKEITVRNLLEKELTISKISLLNKKGYFEDFINLEKMNAVFNSFKGRIIPGTPQEFVEQIFKAELQNGLPENYTSSAEGLLTIKLKNQEFDAVYSKDVEVKLSLGLGARIENDSCLEIVSGETNFSRQTTSQPVMLSYSIENNCIDRTGRAIKINDLKAKVEFSANGKKGNVSLGMKGVSHELKTSEFTQFASSVNSREEMIATLTYTPDTELTGEQGITEFNVIIEAEINTSSGKQTIQTDPSIIKGRIGNVDLLECIEFDPAPKVGTIIEKDSDEGNFSVTNNCGMEIELRFCDSDPRCAGGTEGGITVSPNTSVSALKIRTGQNNSEQITVKRTSIPGIYGIKIEARNQGSSWREINTMDVLAEPNSGHYFSLNNYTIAVPERNVPDIIELYNERLFTNVDVDASNCVWETAQKSSFLKNIGNSFISGAGTFGTVVLYTLIAAGPVGWATAGILAGVTFVVNFIGCITGLFCDDPCDDRTTAPMLDYLINLSAGAKSINPIPDRNPPNLTGIDLSIRGIEVSWDFEEAILIYLNGPPGKEILPLMFEKNTNQYDNIRPTYGILTVNATEHNQTAKLNVPGKDDDRADDLVNFGLPDKYSGDDDNPNYKDYTEVQRKFHVRAVTQRFIEEIPPLYRSLDCVKPTGEIGGTGENALPKVKLNWEWSAIALNECEQTNTNYVYCDSAQFTVMLNKRIHAIDEFMKENGYAFSCPKNAVEELASNQWEETKINIVEEGKIGIKEVNVETNDETNKTKISIIIENKTEISMSVDVKINLTIPEGVEYTGEISCIKPTGNISSGSEKEVFCEFELPEKEQVYIIQASHLPTETGALTNLELFDPNTSTIYYRQAIEESRCWAGTTTEIMAEVFPLNLYLNKTDLLTGKYVTQDSVKLNGTTVYTESPEIKNIIEEIKNLSHFNAYLMKDGFSEDFRQDFAEYYETQAFLEGATWFTDSDSATKNNELAEYYKTGKISFNRKYLNESGFALPEPGLYRIDVSINYSGDKWNLFESNGTPKAQIKIEFTRLATPDADSIFYYMPFDGRIGEKNGVFHRTGYGTGYNNLREKELKVNSEITLYPSDNSSTPLNNISVEKNDSLIEMNSKEETRGSILNLNYDGEEIQMKFYPSKATPVAIKMFHEQTPTTQNPFSYFYGMQEEQTPILAGNDRLGFWNGLGRCRDFEGSFLQNYARWDSKTQSNEVSNYQNLYSIKWNNAVKGGNTFLKTVFYTPTERNIRLKLNTGSSVQNAWFYTADELNSGLVSLNGIQGMQFNSSGSEDYLKNIENVFELVKNGTACISQNNASMKVYWNEQNLFRQSGSKQSINDLEDSLIAGTDCIN
ncbi:MAG: hypothetical protein ABH986_02440 [archaeon]